MFGIITTYPFMFGIIYAGYWLDGSRLPVGRYPRIGKWFVGGLVGFLSLNALMISVWPADALYNNLMWGLFAAVVGGAGGVTIGLFEARAIERALAAERQELKRRRVEERNQRLDEFADTVSHDLRNPLNVASGRLELARADCESEHLAAVADAHDRMESLIDGLLALAKSGRDIQETEQVRLSDVVERCWEHVATANATMAIETDQAVRADRSRLRQLFENLIRNSVEHGGENVTVTVGRLDDGFYFEDDGSGIPVEDRERVFEMGYSLSQEGTGLGLNIVKQVAEAHGWRIRVTDGSDGGARFEVTGVDDE
ncbi:two-component sensor histidine kinase [Halorubrum salipaludis]|uniref:histidine kinase n=1 Tax=Halorubrum salipaludis TaxID=2032630 RepID=A0A2A2FIK9_9EURY|nr:two-component sensor histidine kinase [Halorubrum salipaludis]